MGKRIITEARGKGSPTYRAPSFNYKGEAKHNSYTKETISGVIVDFVKCRGHSAPLAAIEYETGEMVLTIAPEGVKVGDILKAGNEAELKEGHVLPLENIPEGTFIYNIESTPGDGGKFVRSSGTFAKLISKLGKKVVIQLPSKKKKSFSSLCRASIGIVASGGRPEKPLLKAGNAYYKMKAKNKLWPRSSASAMNAVDHPFGNKRTSRKSKARPISKNAPPGRKVGTVAARRTGRKKR